LVLGRKVQTRGLGFVGGLIVSIVPFVIIYQRVILPRVFTSTDTVKMIFAVAINPFLMEVTEPQTKALSEATSFRVSVTPAVVSCGCGCAQFPLCIMRCSVRLLSNNDPATNSFLVGLIVAIKKAFGRFVLVTVADEGQL
jgi:hypothetical protein